MRADCDKTQHALHFVFVCVNIVCNAKGSGAFVIEMTLAFEVAEGVMQLL
jgi:hypothetical protein